MRFPVSWLPALCALYLVVLGVACSGDKRESAGDTASGAASAAGKTSPTAPARGGPLKGDIAPPLAPPSRGESKVSKPLPRAAIGASIDECHITGASYAGLCKDLRDIRLARNGNHVYISQPGNGVRRFTLADGPGCNLTLDRSFGTAGVVAFPSAKPKRQALGKGKVMLSSGGPSYKLAVSPTGQVIVFDFTRGLQRIAGPGANVSCPDMRGVIDVMFAHGNMYIAKFQAVYRVTMSKAGCKRELVPLETGGMTISRIGAWGKRLIVAGSAKARRGKVVRVFDGDKSSVQFGSKDSFADDGMCWVNGAVPCGDGLCVLDGNCRSLKRFNQDGTLHGSMGLSKLLGHGVYGSYDLHRDPGGTVWAALSQRNHKTDTCTLRTHRLGF